MKKFIRKGATLLPLLVLWTIHGFQWRQHPRRRTSPTETGSSNPPKLRHHDDDSHGRFPKRQQRLSFSSVPRGLVSPIQSFSRLWATTPSSNTSVVSSDDTDELNFANQTKGQLLAQAEALRAKAREIRREAEAMEAALQDTTSKTTQGQAGGGRWDHSHIVLVQTFYIQRASSSSIYQQDDESQPTINFRSRL